MTDSPASPAQSTWTLQQIADLVGGTVGGDPTVVISGVAGVEETEPGDLVFAESARFLAAAYRSRAAAVLVPRTLENEAADAPIPYVLVVDARLAFIRVLEAFSPREIAPPGVHPTAQFGSDVRLGEDVRIAAYVVVGDDVVLGDRVVLRPGVSVGDGCRIGDDTVIHPNTVLYPHVTIGRRCIVHAGCVLGSDGFGYVSIGASLKKVPHLGVVEIGDDVEIGANNCIDRAKTGATVIGSGTKLDNLVQVAHNARIGRSCLLAAQVGVAGSAHMGDGIIVGGQAGIKDHITLGDGVRVGAQSGVMKDVLPGVTMFGSPARTIEDRMREIAATGMLPDYLKRIRVLEKRLAALEQGGEDTEST